MKQQYQSIVRQLMQASPQTADMLANILHCSSRTVRNYVRDINTHYPTLIHATRDGYILNHEAIHLLDNELSQHIPQTSKERVAFIINECINQRNKNGINIYDLADLLYISESTLRDELRKTKRKLKQFNLELVQSKDTLFVTGLEKNKRKVLSSLLYDESNNHFVNLESIQNTFKDIDITYIRDTVLEVFDTYHYFVNDYSLMNLMLHITIAVDRIHHMNINAKNNLSLPEIRLHEYTMAHDIAMKLETEFDIKYTESEIYEMALLIISRATTIDYRSITLNNLIDFVGADCYELVKKLLNDIQAYYYIDLSGQEFRIRFALHIRNLLIRSKNNYFSRNPLVDSIKASSPLIYDVAVSLAETIKTETGIQINDDEIAYIAFHIGSALEIQKDLTTKLTADILCPEYYDMNLKITDRVNQYFGSDIIITNIFTDLESLMRTSISNIVITTLPLLTVPTKHTLHINPFFTETDRLLLTRMIDDAKLDKKRALFENHISSLIKPEFFEIQSKTMTQDDCINHMVMKLVEHDYVEQSFYNAILEREQFSSTAFGSVAIPHAMKMNAKKTGAYIVINPNGILWNNTTVTIVLMLCFNINDRYIFNEIFETLSMILTDSKNIKELVTCTSHALFIEKLVSFVT